MRDILPVVVDGLWRQGAKNLAVRLVSAEGQPLLGVDARRPYRSPSSLRADPSVLPDRQPGRTGSLSALHRPRVAVSRWLPLYS